MAENVIIPRCTGQARLWHRPAQPKPWVVEFKLECLDQEPYYFYKAFTKLPDAIRAYITQRERVNHTLTRFLGN